MTGITLICPHDKTPLNRVHTTVFNLKVGRNNPTEDAVARMPFGQMTGELC